MKGPKSETLYWQEDDSNYDLFHLHEKTYKFSLKCEKAGEFKKSKFNSIFFYSLFILLASCTLPNKMTLIYAYLIWKPQRWGFYALLSGLLLSSSSGVKHVNLDSVSVFFFFLYGHNLDFQIAPICCSPFFPRLNIASTYRKLAIYSRPWKIV